MPVVGELYGQSLAAKQSLDIAACRTARCPFMEATCDGGGNRNMAQVSASDQALGPFFDKSVGDTTGGFLPCGICTVRSPRENSIWAICPRRLLSFGADGVSDRHKRLADHIFAIAGFSPNEKIDVWSEISLRESGEGKAQFNYRLDYVLRSTAHGAVPIIVEVMTASTSGGNRSKGTDIQGAFRRAVLYTQQPINEARQPINEAIKAPGVNIRQVWARMASQMIAKSEAANSWGGRTIWVVQDRLVDYIRSNTALPLDDLRSPNWLPGEVNMLVSDLAGPTELYAGPIRPSGSSRKCWMELLGTPHIPTLESISQKLEKSKPIATITVPP